MRISTNQIYDASSANYQRNYAKFIQAGEQTTTGVKLNSASDDPVGAARVLQLAQQNSMLDQYASNITTINYNAANTETALESIGTALQTISELVIKGGNGAYTDADRISTAEQIKQLQSQLLGLMNSQDANGRYLFSGSDAAQPPYSMNSDGTYSYHGNQTSVGLAVGDGLILPSNTTGWEAFDKAVNTTRTSLTATGATPNDDKFNMSSGIVSSTTTYNSSFIAGQPYTLSIVSGPQYAITDAAGNDVTGDASTAGAFSFANSENQLITFRGVDLNLNINLSAAESVDAATAEGVLLGRTYELSSTPPSISPVRSAGNTSAAVITTAAVGTTAAEKELFNTTFPTGGAVLKFVPGGYELYAAPLSNNNPPVAVGTGSGPTISAAGVSFTISGTPNDGDQFVVESSTHQTKNVLNTLTDVIKALTTPTDGSAVGLQKLNASLNSAMGNINMALEQSSTARSAIGARQNAATDQGVTNDLLKGNNTVESQSFTKADEMEAATQLTLQKNILAASQQVFLQLSSLNLFSKL